jgi:hypothetical protein
MKKILQNLLHPALRPILLGTIGFVALNLLFTAGVTFSPLNQRFNFKYGNFLPAKLAMLKTHHPEKLDVLFMGTSQTNNGFIPRVFEQASGHPINSFNLGLPNNRYDIMLAYLQYHQYCYGKPKLLLVELSPSIQEKDAYLYYLPALYYRTLIEQAPNLAGTYLSNPLLAENVKQELLWSSFSSLHQYRYTFAPINVISKVSGKLKSLSGFHDASAEAAPTYTDDDSDTPADTSMQFDPSYTEKGWYPKPQSPHMKTPDGVQLSVAEARKYYIDQQKDVQFDKLKTLLEYCKQQQIPVVLVSWPNHPAFLSVFEHSKLNSQYQAGLQQLLHEEPATIINLNREIPASQKTTEGGLFADPRHLTPDGAKLFSAKLAQDVFSLPQVQYWFHKS